MANTLIKTFKQISKTDTEIAGGKGASLGEMTQAGIPVPDGFVILANAFNRFLEETDLNVEIDAVLDKVDIKKVHTVKNASEKIQAMILSEEIPEDIKKEILKNYKKLNSKFVAVRSSATSEDSASAAWAGQLDSFLNTTKETLLENVKKCWASLFTPRAIFYRFEKNLHKEKISVAVIVQKMVDSEKSGIAFSVHPVTQDKNQIIIEAGFGLGKAIVSGSITPDSYVIDKQGYKILDVNVNNQTKALYKKPKGGNEWRELGEKGKKQVLTEKKIVKLSKLIEKIENHYGFPCDIEWASENGKFYIVQSKPITTISKKNTFQEIITFRKRKTPLLMPIIYYFTPYNEERVGFNFGMGFTIIERGWSQTSFTKNDFTSAGKILLQKTIKNPLLLKRRLEESEKFGYKWIKWCKANFNKQNLSKYSNKELYTRLEKFINNYETYSCLNIPPWMYMGDMLFKYIKDNLSKKYFLKKDEVISLTTPLTKTYTREFDEQFLNLALFIKEQKKNNLTLKNIIQYPKIEEKIDLLVKNYFWIPFDYIGPETLDKKHILKELNQELKNAREEIITKINNIKKEAMDLKEKQRRIIEKYNLTKKEINLIKAMQDVAILQDDKKAITTQAHFYLFQFMKEVSKRLHISTDELYLLLKEEFKETLLKRKDYSKELKSRKKLCIAIYTTNSVKVFSSNSALEKIKYYGLKLHSKIEKFNNKTIKGQIASQGIFKGKAKILLSAKELSKINKGEILVATMTTPDYVPAMKKAGAIITDEGGITCHAAIVSRELKIPCIIGTGNATSVLKDGDIVEVDANKGVVRIIKK